MNEQSKNALELHKIFPRAFYVTFSRSFLYHEDLWRIAKGQNYDILFQSVRGNVDLCILFILDQTII